MHAAYAEEVLQLAARTTSAARRPLASLKRTCLHVASRHVAHMDTEALIGLPVSLVQDLLPHLSIYDLIRLQPALNQRGTPLRCYIHNHHQIQTHTGLDLHTRLGRISTHSAWVLILQDIKGAHRVLDLHSEDGSKQEAMDTCFQLMFYGFKYKGVAKQIFNVNITTLFLVMAKYIKRFYLRPSQFLQTFAKEQRALLTILEGSVGVVDVKHHKDLLKAESQFALYVLHRLVDHGQAKELIIYGLDPAMLNWILQDRGSQHAHHHQQQQQQQPSVHRSNPTAAAAADNSADTEEGGVAPCKRPKLDVRLGEPEAETLRSPVEPELLCQAFALYGSCLSGSCPRGQICSLQIRECGRSTLGVLVPFLPTWLCLRSLTIQSCWIFRVTEVQLLATSLKQLGQTSSSSLVDLSVAVLPQTALMERLLDACPGLHSLSLEIHPLEVDPGPHGTGVTPEPAVLQELSLKKLSVKVPQVLADIHSITAVLKHSPHLTSLHISGIRLPTSSSHREILSSISEFNHRLRTLHLEDINLADCHQDILNLLRNCMLEELSLKDCRLLEKCSDRESYLQQLMDSLKKVRSLRSLCLSQNRLAKSAPALAELFTGSPSSAVKRLDISSNFIQPAELLELGQRLQTHPPQQRLTLDLRKNPWDRDRETWHDALRTLRPLCDFLTDGWKSRNTMADHISNM
ncbi:Leucine-rich repeat-containing protein 41 [Merluccius polli]|uniref:Leucine-rich repeat-containing protein 41 n=1 Tax=Merluccius polli TaxID=89951 RepID=A0AA47MC92_MERPO|nr:Leucine-rich repeat-containing protein 41 [Merluccius polli]